MGLWPDTPGEPGGTTVHADRKDERNHQLGGFAEKLIEHEQEAAQEPPSERPFLTVFGMTRSSSSVLSGVKMLNQAGEHCGAPRHVVDLDALV